MRKSNIKASSDAGVVGMGNALVDVLARIEDDQLIGQMGLTRGGMVLVDADGYARLGTVLGRLQPTKASGGSARNTIAALSHMGGHTAFIGKVGRDENGDFLLADCRKAGIEPRLSLSETLPTGVASTLISADGQRTFGTFLGAAATLRADDLNEAMLHGYGLLYVEGYLVQDHVLMDRAMQLAREAGLAVALDLASYNVVAGDRDFFRHLLRDCVDLVFANEEESYAFTGEADAQRAAHMLAELTGEAVVKVGARGAYAATAAVAVHVEPQAAARVVDTTAAGDFFAAGYLLGRGRGCSPAICLALGNLLGGAVIGVVGTALSEAQWEQLRAQAHNIIAADARP